ncbi:MAG: N-acetyltransferase [Barnesiella sp.]|nr:N-acetyltransferase [Barnesiella sp.]
MKIHPAKRSDIPRIIAIFDAAKIYMRAQGNHVQWTGSYPEIAIIEKDISDGNLYVGIGNDGVIHCAFSLIPGNDPTYSRIENGQWLNNEPYFTIHRLASDGYTANVLKRCVAFSFNLTENIRIDTHESNRTMLAALSTLGFIRCGTIYVNDGTPRIAFQKRL